MSEMLTEDPTGRARRALDPWMYRAVRLRASGGLHEYEWHEMSASLQREGLGVSLRREVIDRGPSAPIGWGAVNGLIVTDEALEGPHVIEWVRPTASLSIRAQLVSERRETIERIRAAVIEAHERSEHERLKAKFG